MGFSSDAALRFAGFLRCDSRTIMKSFLKKNPLANSQDICIKIAQNFLRIQERFFEKLLHYCTTIAPQKSCEKPANRRAACDEKPTPDHTSQCVKFV